MKVLALKPINTNDCMETRLTRAKAIINLIKNQDSDLINAEDVSFACDAIIELLPKESEIKLINT